MKENIKEAYECLLLCFNPYKYLKSSLETEIHLLGKEAFTFLIDRLHQV